MCSPAGHHRNGFLEKNPARFYSRWRRPAPHNLPLNPLKRLWTHQNQLWRTSIAFATALPIIIPKGDWELVFWFFHCGKPTRKGITQVTVHIIGLLPKLTGHYNKKLVALTERAHCKYITPSKTITQLFFLPTFQYFTSQQRHSKIWMFLSTSWRRRLVPTCFSWQTNKLAIATKKIMSDQKVSPTIWPKDFANFITKWLLAYITKEWHQIDDSKLQTPNNNSNQKLKRNRTHQMDKSKTMMILQKYWVLLASKWFIKIQNIWSCKWVHGMMTQSGTCSNYCCGGL